MIATKNKKTKIRSGSKWTNETIPWDTFTWYDEAKYFPLKNCIRYEGGINIVVGIRNDGKTFGMLEFMREDFEHSGYQSILIYNSQTTINTMRANSILMNKQMYPEKWNKYKVTNDGIVEISTGIVAIYIMSIHSARNYKGGRMPNIKRIAIDEFNRFDDKIKNRYPEMIDELLVTWAMNKNDVEFILMGNALSVNHRLLVHYKIMELPQGLSKKSFEVSDDYILLYNYKRDKDQLEKRYTGNWVFNLTKFTGSFLHNFNNQMLNDDNNFLMKHIPQKHLRYVSSFSAEGYIFEVYRIEGVGKDNPPFYIKDAGKETTNEVVAGTQKEVKNGRGFEREWRQTMIGIIVEGQMLYANQFVKDTVYNIIH